MQIFSPFVESIYYFWLYTIAQPVG